MIKVCKIHGETKFHKRTESKNPLKGWRCSKCNSEQITLHRRKLIKTLIDELGGRCIRCGYESNYASLCFHHRQPNDKSFRISSGNIKSLDKLRKEAIKCDLLCYNCHYEIHNPHLSKLFRLP